MIEWESSEEYWWMPTFERSDIHIRCLVDRFTNYHDTYEALFNRFGDNGLSDNPDLTLDQVNQYREDFDADDLDDGFLPVDCLVYQPDPGNTEWSPTFRLKNTPLGDYSAGELAGGATFALVAAQMYGIVLAYTVQQATQFGVRGRQGGQ